MKKTLILTSFCIIFANSVFASPMTFEFSNPSFSGDGYSAHVLSIENQEYQRKQAIEAQKRADQAMKEAAAKNTNLAKFLNNLESRIYAQLSLQLANAMFSDGATSGTVTFEGTTMTWLKDAATGMITLTIIDASGNKTEIEIPIGSFKF